MRTANPWKWPLCTSTALLLLLLGAWLVPRDWFFLGARSAVRGPILPDVQRSWMVLVPPPEIEVVKHPHPPTGPSARPGERPEFQPADWWQRGVAVRLGAEVSPTVPNRTGVGARDSIRVALDLLGITPGLLNRVRPDSLLAARLQLLRVQGGFEFEEMKPYLGALGRATAYRDIMSRATDMFGDFLQHEITVTPRADTHGDPP